MLNLHCHSEYSSQDSISRVKDIAKRSKELGNDSFVITDHGNFRSFPEAFKVAKAENMHFIPGIEFYLKPEGMNDLKENLLARQEPLRILKLKTTKPEEKEEAQKKLDELINLDAQKYYHLTCIAISGEGLKNLYRIYSDCDYYYKDRVKMDTVKKYSKGIVVLSGCLAGELPHYVRNGWWDKAKNYLEDMKKSFEDNFYLELQNHMIPLEGRDAEKGYPSEEETYKKIIELAKEFDIKLVATNDSHYTYENQASMHALYKNMCYFKAEDAKDRENSFSGTGYHMVSAEELIDRFKLAGYDNWAIEQSIKSVDEIRAKVLNPGELYMEQGEPLKPRPELLREMVMKGWEKKRKGTPMAEASLKQIEYELSIMEEKNFTSYFTNMTTIISKAKELGIMTGVGRGSAAGSEVVYLLDITKCDPMKYGLIFERFLNPARASMPDIDTDFATRGSWGDQLGTQYLMDNLYETFPFRARIGNVVGGSSIVLFKKLASYCRVPFSEANKFTTSDLGKDFLEKEKPGDWKEFTDILNALNLSSGSDEWKAVFDQIQICYDLRDIVFGNGIHASGVIMTENESVLPVDHDNVINFNGVSLEEYGYIKYDFLSLDTLNAIQAILGMDYDWNKNDDPEVWKTIQSGDLDFIFQLAGGVPRQMCMEGKANSIEDLSLITSINRPGPLNMGLNKTWIDVRKGVHEFDENEKIIARILKNAFGEQHSGLLVYQEDIMKLCTDGAGLSMVESDHIRKAMGKKKMDLMMSYKDKFIEGWNKTTGEGDPEKIWDQMAEFAKYCFNKAHAVCYSIISYATAALWTHHKDEFLQYQINEGTSKQRDKALKACKDMGYKFQYPEISSSEVNDKYIVKNRTVYVPNDNSHAFESFSEFIFSDISSLEKNKLILQGGCDKFTLDRKGLTDFIKAIPSDLMGQEFEKSNSLIDLLYSGKKNGLWTYIEDNEKYHIIFALRPRSRTQKIVDIYKNSKIPNERLEFNIKHDIKNFGSSKANQLDALPKLNEELLLRTTLRTRDMILEPYDGDVAKLKESPNIYEFKDARKKLERVYLNNLKDPKIANSINFEDEQFKCLFMSMTVSKQYGSAKVILSFDNEANSIFWIRDQNVISKFQKLMKKSICRIKIKSDMYINKDLMPILQIKIIDVIEEKKPESDNNANNSEVKENTEVKKTVNMDIINQFLDSSSDGSEFLNNN